MCEATPEARVQEQAFGRVRVGIADLGRWRPIRGVTDAAKAIRAGSDVRFEHRPNGVAKGEVSEADDRGRGAHWPVAAAGAHRGDALDEFRFAYGAHLGRAIGAVHGEAFDEDRAGHVVMGPVLATSGVGHQFVQEIAVPGVVPEVVVGVADLQLWFEDLFAYLVQPCVVVCHAVTSSAQRYAASLAKELANGQIGVGGEPAEGRDGVIRFGLCCATQNKKLRPQPAAWRFTLRWKRPSGWSAMGARGAMSAAQTAVMRVRSAERWQRLCRRDRRRPRAPGGPAAGCFRRWRCCHRASRATRGKGPASGRVRASGARGRLPSRSCWRPKGCRTIDEARPALCAA